MVPPGDGIVFKEGPDFKNRTSQAKELVAKIVAEFKATLDWRHAGELICLEWCPGKQVCLGVRCAYMTIDGKLYWVLFKAEGATCGLLNVFQMPAEEKACKARIEVLKEMHKANSSRRRHG